MAKKDKILKLGNSMISIPMHTEPEHPFRDTNLPDGDYTLTEGAAWFTVKNFSVRVYSTDEGIVVDIYPVGRETEDSVASTYAYDSEVEEVEG